MGQPVRVIARRMERQDVVRFELDRSLTGTGHESYAAPPDAAGDRPVDVLAARAFGTGSVAAVHAFSNLVTITLRPDRAGADSLDSLQGVIEGLFIHYLPGVEPTAV